MFFDYFFGGFKLFFLRVRSLALSLTFSLACYHSLALSLSLSLSIALIHSHCKTKQTEQTKNAPCTAALDPPKEVTVAVKLPRLGGTEKVSVSDIAVAPLTTKVPLLRTTELAAGDEASKPVPAMTRSVGAFWAREAEFSVTVGGAGGGGEGGGGGGGGVGVVVGVGGVGGDGGGTHTPREHVPPVEHAVPQIPQFCGSDCSVLHALEQSEVPGTWQTLV